MQWYCMVWNCIPFCSKKWHSWVSFSASVKHYDFEANFFGQHLDEDQVFDGLKQLS